MPRKKNTQKPKGEISQRRDRGAHIHWVWVALVVGLLFGGASGYFIGQASSDGGGTLVADRYGRAPGHPHYGHNHP